MKALVARQPGELIFEELPIPVPGPYDVLTKVKFCGICGTDVSIYTGETGLVRDGLIKYPVRPGHEWSGIVEAVGSEVTEFRPGDRVTGDTVVSCGVCKACLGGNYMKCISLRCVGTINAWDGGFAEYTLFPARHIYKVPENISLEQAALIEPAAIGMNGLVKADFRSGQTVLVIGTGAIGLLAAALANASGASKVILAGRKDNKLDIGSQMGADVLVNVTKQNLQNEVMKETDGKGVDLVIEASGAVSALKESLNLVSVDGAISLLGFYEQELDGINIDKAVFNCIRIIGVAGSPNIYPVIISLLTSGKVDFGRIITDRYAFADAIQAFNDMKGKNETRIKIMLEF